MLSYVNYALIVVGAYFMFLSPKLPEITISIISFFTFASISFNAASNIFEGKVEFFRYVLPITGITVSIVRSIATFFSHPMFVGSVWLLVPYVIPTLCLAEA